MYTRLLKLLEATFSGNRTMSGASRAYKKIKRKDPNSIKAFKIKGVVPTTKERNIKRFMKPRARFDNSLDDYQT